MSLKYYNPVTPGTRGKVGLDRSQLWKGGPFKSLCEGMSNTGGRNAQGRMTSRHRVSVHRKVYRNISFDRKFLDGIDATVVRLEYDPNRNAYIALLKYQKKENEGFCYIIAPKDLKIGDVVSTSYTGRTDYKVGDCMLLKHIKDGTEVHCIELKIGKGACISRSAGCSARILGTDEKGMSILQLASGELKLVNKNCTACIGVVGNELFSSIKLGKAGASFHRGVRPKVRGIAMNPVDHHNGGRANGGTHFASKNGNGPKGKKTRRNKRTTNTIMKKRSR